jgi:outer membrane biosynthesis protein TonB
MKVPIDTPVSQPLGRTGRILGVLAFVLTVHAWALYQAALSMAMMPPAEVTQATLSVALLAPPAPAAQAAAPSPTPPPRHKSARTPTLPPPAPPAPEPEPEPPPEAAEPLEPTAEPMPEPPSEAPVEPAPAPDEPAQPSLIDGAQALPTQGRIVYRTTYSRLRGLSGVDVRRLDRRSGAGALRTVAAHR